MRWVDILKVMRVDSNDNGETRHRHVVQRAAGSFIQVFVTQTDQFQGLRGTV